MGIQLNGCILAIMDATFHLADFRRYYHPFPIFLCFLSLILLLVLIPHPIITFLSLVISGIFLILSKQLKGYSFIYSFILYILIILINPVFVTKGATVLFYFFGAPYTLEALVYGIVFANMVMSLLWWSLIFRSFLTSDHIIYLFSKPFKVLGLMIAVVFRLIPKFKKQMQDILLYQKKYSNARPLKKGLDALLISITWAFESSLTMVDSMSARGYQSKRTHFHLFHFNFHDLKLCILIVFIDLWMLAYYFKDFSNYYFYPKIKPISLDCWSLISYLMMTLLMVLPSCFKKEGQHVKG